MERITFDPRMNDLDVMRALRKQGLRPLRAVPGRLKTVKGGIVRKSERQTVVIAVRE